MPLPTSRRAARFAWLIVAITCITPSAAGAASTTPMTQTKHLVDGLKSVKTAPEGGVLSAAYAKTNATVFTKLDDFFDYERLVGDPVSAHRAAFDEANWKRYSASFRQLIQLLSYPKSGSYLREATLAYGAETITGDQATVVMHTEMKAEDFENDVTFHWRQNGTSWRVVDVSFDGASLVKDYTNQFARIIKQDGVAGLVQKLETRLQKERAPKGAN